jgi:pSer/pThr/pTyr-binding forkhead associated (FHA) protein
LLFVGRSRYNDIVIADETVSRVHCIIVRSSGTVGVFDGWSSYGTVTVERGRADLRCEESAVDNRRPLLFDEGESFTLRVGKYATIQFSG